MNYIRVIFGYLSGCEIEIDGKITTTQKYYEIMIYLFTELEPDFIDRSDPKEFFYNSLEGINGKDLKAKSETLIILFKQNKGVRKY
jgi:hypothetical protein